MEPRYVNRGNIINGIAKRKNLKSFNGAAVCEPRKCYKARLEKHKAAIASMEPRYVNRGNLEGRAGCESRDRGFNGAAVCEPRKLPRSQLQELRGFTGQVARARSVPALRSSGNGPVGIRKPAPIKKFERAPG